MPAAMDSPHLTNGHSDHRSSRRRSPEDDLDDRKDRRERRHRSRSRDRDRKEKTDKTDKDRERDREKERRGEREREREKERERERAERHRERDRERERYVERPSDRDRDRPDKYDRDREHRRRSELDNGSPYSERSRSKRHRDDFENDVPRGGLSIIGAASSRRLKDEDADVDMDRASRDGRSETGSRRGSERARDDERRRDRLPRERDIDIDREYRDRRQRDPPPPPSLPPPPPPLRDRSPPPRERSARDRYLDSPPRRSPPPPRRRGPRPMEGDTYIPGEPGSPPRPMHVERIGVRERPDSVPPRASGSPPVARRSSPAYEAPPPPPAEPEELEDSEQRSVFVSQLAARLSARDLGYFFEEKLGEGAVRDVRIVTDRVSRRSKGIAYVELKSIDMVSRAIALTGTVVMGLPIMVQLTESERNKIPASGSSMHLPPGVTAPPPGSMQLYVGSLHFNLTENDIKQVFEPFGELEFVDLHRDPLTGRSKGFAFVQYKRSEDARMALEQMDGFDLAGRQLKVNTVHEKGSAIRYQGQGGDSLEESGGGNLNAASRQALMQKLARIEPAKPPPSSKPDLPKTAMQSRSVLLRNMFGEPETEEQNNGPDWAKELADDVRGECDRKYGSVDFIKVERDSQGEIYVKFKDVESAAKAVEGLNGRWFGGNTVQATFISDAILQAHQ